jgi:hypothetical protein
VASLSDPELRVSEVETDYYQIETSPFWRNKWWTARKLDTRGWYITNNRGTVIKETSVLGRRIIKAIEEFCNALPRT